METHSPLMTHFQCHFRCQPPRCCDAHLRAPMLVHPSCPGQGAPPGDPPRRHRCLAVLRALVARDHLGTLAPADSCLVGLRRIVTPYSAHLTGAVAVPPLGEPPQVLPHHQTLQRAACDHLQPICPPLQHHGLPKLRESPTHSTAATSCADQRPFASACMPGAYVAAPAAGL